MGNAKRKRDALNTVNRNVRRFRLNNMYFPSNPNTEQKPPPVPPRPKNQNEAMGITLTVEPSEEDVQMLMSFTDATRSDVIRFLKVSTY